MFTKCDLLVNETNNDWGQWPEIGTVVWMSVLDDTLLSADMVTELPASSMTWYGSPRGGRSSFDNFVSIADNSFYPLSCALRVGHVNEILS
jgi:hypothetical protein